MILNINRQMILRYNNCTMLKLFKKTERKIVNLDEVFFDESNKDDFYKKFISDIKKKHFKKIEEYNFY